MDINRTVSKLCNGEHVTIVALGDSITEITFHTRGRMNWVGLLQEAIFEEYRNGICTLINSGKCGSTYEEALTRLERDVLRFTPDLVILALGMNDAGRGIEYLDEFRNIVRKTINKIIDACNSEILIRTPNPVVPSPGIPFPCTHTHTPGAEWKNPNRPLDKYAEALVQIAEEKKCAYVDHYTLWTKQSFSTKHPVANHCGLWLRMGDAIHPGYAGHLAFFRELAPMFKVSPYFPWEVIKHANS